MRHEPFFKFFWLLGVGGMWYLGTHFNQLWQADAYEVVHWISSVAIFLLGVFTLAHWVDLYQTDPGPLNMISENPVRTFYWRAWMFRSGDRGMSHPFFDDALVIIIAIAPVFFAGHVAGPMMEGFNLWWYPAAAIVVAGVIPIWIRRQNICQWREYINSDQSEVADQKPKSPSTSPEGSRRRSTRKSKAEAPPEDGNVVSLRPSDDEKSELTA